EEQAAKDHVAQAYAQAGLQPLALEEVLQQVKGIDAGRAQRFAQMLINSGELVRVGELVFHKTALDSLLPTLQAYKTQHGAKLDVGAFKDLTGISRKYAIPLLEYCDRQRITRRSGDAREVL
ncbi:MAG: selenocysteine-specific translation factor, partial [Acidobacteria bacterium]|nr:selenocysteine-specific translation factor [Acidobacteriota bacterium]